MGTHVPRNNRPSMMGLMFLQVAMSQCLSAACGLSALSSTPPSCSEPLGFCREALATADRFFLRDEYSRPQADSWSSEP